MKEAPPNLSVVWHRGDKSFVELLLNGKKQLAYKEAEAGKQLPDGAFNLVFQVALGLAKQNPNNKYHFTRYDNESIVPEDENNREFRGSSMSKVIYYMGYMFSSKM